jgi:hypothetical protein
VPISHGLAASFCVGLAASLATRVFDFTLILTALVLGVAAVILPSAGVPILGADGGEAA